MNFLEARQNMVNGQLRPNRIRNPRVLAAFAKVPREKFLPVDLQEVAYADTHLVFENERVVLPPLIQARMLQALDIQPQESVLVLGGLEGYMPALVLELGATMHVVEPNPHRAVVGQNNVQDMKGEKTYYGEGWHNKEPLSGLKKFAPYHHIIINMPIDDVPEALFLQLKQEGKLAAVVSSGGISSVMCYTRRGRTCFAESLTEVQSLPIPKPLQREERFVF